MNMYTERHSLCTEKYLYIHPNYINVHNKLIVISISVMKKLWPCIGTGTGTRTGIGTGKGKI